MITLDERFLILFFLLHREVFVLAGVLLQTLLYLVEPDVDLPVGAVDGG